MGKKLPDDIVACMKATGKPMIKGTTKEKCIRCGSLVWVSPASWTSIEKGIYPNVFACLDCIKVEIKNEQDNRHNKKRKQKAPVKK